MNKVLIVIIMLIVTFSISWNLYQWKYINDLEKVETGLNIEFEELKNMIGSSSNEEILEKIEEIEHYGKFQQTICFSD